jgi:hypothetical protein
MPLQLPNLDDRSYADLVEEARRLIPVIDPEWTDHNPSDPGIMLLELFAFVAEMLLYRLDRVTAENQRNFLKLLNGPAWQPGPDLDANIRTSVNAVRARERAVTTADFERLALSDFNAALTRLQRAEEQQRPIDEWWRISGLDVGRDANLPSRVPLVGRAHCLASRNLEADTDAGRKQSAPGHVSLIVLPKGAYTNEPPESLLGAVWAFLDQRRMLTTRHHVVGPRYAHLRVEATIATAADVSASDVSRRIVERLHAFLTPFAGDDTAGWPFGRDVFVSELCEQIEAAAGVDYIADLMLFSAEPAGDRDNGYPRIWHSDGDLIGLAIEPDRLPMLRDPQGIAVGPSASFVPVQVLTTLVRRASAAAADVKRDAKLAVRSFFYPRQMHDSPDLDSTTLALSHLETALKAIAGVASVKTLEMRAGAGRLVTRGADTLLRLDPGEIVNWQTEVTVEDE